MFCSLGREYCNCRHCEPNVRRVMYCIPCIDSLHDKLAKFPQQVESTTNLPSDLCHPTCMVDSSHHSNRLPYNKSLHLLTLKLISATRLVGDIGLPSIFYPSLDPVSLGTSPIGADIPGEWYLCRIRHGSRLRSSHAPKRGTHQNPRANNTRHDTYNAMYVLQT